MVALIITNGDSAGGCLQEAYPDAHILPWRDLLHEGPVPLGDDLSAQRARYIEQMWGVEAQADFQERDRVLSRLPDFSSITLWFEHDLYDQLQLLQVLEALNGCGQAVRLVQADDYLGHETPETITRWQEVGGIVTDDQFSLAAKAWTALRQKTPEAWCAVLDEETSALPHLKAAIVRMLEELPSAKAGISRTERHILEVIDAGAETPGQIFQAYQNCEEARFMGDWSFFSRMEDLTRTEHPALRASTDAIFAPRAGDEAIEAYLKTSFALTDFGSAVVAENQDFAAYNAIDYWWGGTHITNANLWRWDASSKVLVEPYP